MSIETQIMQTTFQLKSNQKQIALNRINQNIKTFNNNAILLANLSVIESINKKTQQNKQETQNKKIKSNETINLNLIKILQKSLQSYPLSFTTHYNLFVLFLRAGNKKQSLLSLVRSICSLNLQIGLKELNEQILTKISLKYCTQSIHTFLIKAIVHIKNQKYILAINDIDKSILLEKEDIFKQKYLEVKKEILERLMEKQKAKKVQEELELRRQNNNNKNLIQQRNQKLQINYQIPENQKVLKQEIVQKFKQFKDIFKKYKLKNLGTHQNLSNILICKINPQILNRNYLIRDYLSLKLKQEFQMSPLYLKNEQKQLHAIHHIHQPLIKSGYKQKQSLAQPKTLFSNRISPKQFILKEPQIKEKIKQNIKTNSKQMNRVKSSQWITPVKSPTKKSDSIYPTFKVNPQVQIKLVMAQITNNKQILGSIDPYCIIIYNKQKKTSTVVKKGGLQPRWKQSFIFKLSPQESQLEIEIWDKQLFKRDDFIGSTKVMFNKIGFLKLPIYQKQKDAGFVFITVDVKK